MDFTNIKKNLEALEYTVSCFETAAEAAEYLTGAIQNTTVGFGGSMTLKEMGLYEKLGETNKVYWHWILPEGMTQDDARAHARNTEVYLSSANGIAETGEIVNIDGNGNRVAETLFGHKKVYIIVGKNKIAPDYDGALWHARNVAAPKNAHRMNRKTPCAVNGDKCYDCKSPDRICRGLVVLWKKPMCCPYEVVLINEDLGY